MAATCTDSDLKRGRRAFGGATDCGSAKPQHWRWRGRHGQPNAEQSTRPNRQEREDGETRDDDVRPDDELQGLIDSRRQAARDLPGWR